MKKLDKILDNEDLQRFCNASAELAFRIDWRTSEGKYNTTTNDRLIETKYLIQTKSCRHVVP